MAEHHRARLQATSWFAVVRAYQECTRQYSRMLAAFGLTIPQFDVLSAILALGDAATPKAIAAELLVTRGNITGVLHRLQSQDLVRTEPHDQDGRSFICHLTPQGQALLAEARRAAALFIEQQLAPFDESQLRQTEQTMQQMQAHLSTLDPEAIATQARKPRA